MSLIVFAMLRLVTDGRTDGRNRSSERRLYAVKCIGRQKRFTSFIRFLLRFLQLNSSEIVIHL